MVGYSEYNKYADCCYRAIHNVDKKLNYGDITLIKPQELPDFDIMNFSFPCKDISNAGKMKGFIQDGKLTHSGLYKYGVDIVKIKKPKYIITENVSNLVGKAFFKDFEGILKELNDIGYINYWSLLNTKDFNLPQNRNRVYIVSIRNDIKKSYIFPEPQKREIDLIDLLETDVDEKYLYEDKTGFIEIIYDTNTYTAKVNEATKKGYAIANIGDSINLEFPTSKTRRGRVGHSIAQTLTVSCNQGTLMPNGLVRKLIPRECWLLQGFTTEDYNKAYKALIDEFKTISDNQLYERAGRTISVPVLENIFKNLLLK